MPKPLHFLSTQISPFIIDHIIKQVVNKIKQKEFIQKNISEFSSNKLNSIITQIGESLFKEFQTNTSINHIYDNQNITYDQMMPFVVKVFEKQFTQNTAIRSRVNTPISADFDLSRQKSPIHQIKKPVQVTKVQQLKSNYAKSSIGLINLLQNKQEHSKFKSPSDQKQYQWMIDNFREQKVSQQLIRLKKQKLMQNKKSSIIKISQTLIYDDQGNYQNANTNIKIRPNLIQSEVNVKFNNVEINVKFNNVTANAKRKNSLVYDKHNRTTMAKIQQLKNKSVDVWNKKLIIDEKTTKNGISPSISKRKLSQKYNLNKKTVLNMENVQEIQSDNKNLLKIFVQPYHKNPLNRPSQWINQEDLIPGSKISFGKQNGGKQLVKKKVEKSIEDIKKSLKVNTLVYDNRKTSLKHRVQNIEQVKDKLNNTISSFKNTLSRFEYEKIKKQINKNTYGNAQKLTTTTKAFQHFNRQYVIKKNLKCKTEAAKQTIQSKQYFQKFKSPRNKAASALLNKQKHYQQLKKRSVTQLRSDFRQVIKQQHADSLDSSYQIQDNQNSHRQVKFVSPKKTVNQKQIGSIKINNSSILKQQIFDLSASVITKYNGQSEMSKFNRSQQFLFLPLCSDSKTDKTVDKTLTNIISTDPSDLSTPLKVNQKYSHIFKKASIVVHRPSKFVKNKLVLE